MSKGKLSMVLDKQFTKAKLFILFLFAGLFISTMNIGQVSAGVSRGAKNGVEQGAIDQCTLSSDHINGAVWINSVPGSDGSDARWSENITIAYDATTIDATMWTTAYNCDVTSRGAQIENLASASSQVPISFPYGTAIYRGDSDPKQFTDPPGQITVRLDLSGKGSGDYTVTYTGNFRDNRGPGKSKTYTNTIHVTRQDPPPPPHDPPHDPPPDPPPQYSYKITGTVYILNNDGSYTKYGSTPSISPGGYCSYSSGGSSSCSLSQKCSLTTGAYSCTMTGDSSGAAYSLTFTMDLFVPSGYDAYDPNPPHYSTTATSGDTVNLVWDFIIKKTPVYDTKPTLSITVDCDLQHAIITSSDADASGTFTTNYQINGGAMKSYSYNSGQPFTLDLSSLDQTQMYIVYATTNGKRKSGADDVAPPASYSIQYGPCLTSIDPFTITPTGNVDLNDDENPTQATFKYGADADRKVFKVTIKRSYYKNSTSSPIAGGGSEVQNLNTTYANSEIKSISAVVGDKICEDVTVSPAAGTVGNTGQIITTTVASVTKTYCGYPAAKPYLKVYGGDVMAGGGYGSDCAKSASIKMLKSASKGVVASTDQGAFASGDVINFVSAALNSGTSFPVNDGFTSKSYKPGSCLTDFFANKQGSAFSSFPTTASTSFKYFKVDGDYIINSAVSINKGVRVVLFVDGKLTINGNITYANVDTRSNINDIQALYIVARNIDVNKTVTQLDGTYIAQNSGPSDGVINTCKQADTTCNAALTINGSLIAKQVRFLRTFNTMKNGSSSEPYTATKAAEIIHFWPEVFLLGSPFGGGDTHYNAFAELPPNF